MSRSHAPLDPHAVLAGRIEVNAAELLDLIHRVNPTGRDLPAAEAHRRYALKSRLQSLLVRRFADALEVSVDAGGTVSLVHRYEGRDACHALLAELDDDARSWVQLQIDLGPPASVAPPCELTPVRPPEPARESILPPSSAAGPDSLVRRADRAVDSFDFDRARGQFNRALSVSAGAPGPAEAFLVLLVDTLGDDAAALALQPTLSPAALAHPHVRALLALAAARSGDEAGALALLRGADAERSSGVLAALAAAAIAAGDAVRGGAHLAELRRRDPAHPSIAVITGDLARLRSSLRGPAEAEILALASAGQHADLIRKAAEVLARWPESEVARRALRSVEEQRRHGEAARLQAEAEAAVAAGQPDAAIAALARAAGIAAGPEREAIERRAREVEALARATREARAVDEVRRLLPLGDGREGLAAYLDLADARSAEVRAWSTAVPGLEARLRRIELARGAPRARVDAVLALERAAAQVAVDPELARAHLAPHLGALDRVPEARQMAREAEGRIAAQRLARARDAVAGARVAFAAGRMDEVIDGLDEAVLRELPEPERAGAAALRAAASPVVARARRAAEVARFAQSGRLFEARDLALSLSLASEGEERARWDDETRRLQEAIQRAFRVDVDDAPAVLDGGRDPFPALWFHRVPRWLTEDGSAFVLAEGRGQRLVLCVVDREGLRLRATVTLRPPEPFDCDWYEVVGPVLWLVSDTGAALAILLSTWEIVLFRPSLERRPGRRLEYLPLLPSGLGPDGPSQPRFLWTVTAADDDAREEYRAFDLEGRRPPRASGFADFGPLAGAREPRLVSVTAEADAVVLYEDRGVPAPEGRFPVPGGKVLQAVLRPDGEGLVALVEQPARGEQLASLAWVDVPFRGPARPAQPLAELHPDTVRLARAAEEGLVLVTGLTEARGLEMVAIGAAGDAESAPAASPPPLVELWRAPCPTQRLILAGDAAGARLMGWEQRPEGTLLVDVRRAAPPVTSDWRFDIEPMLWAGKIKLCLRHNEVVQQMKRRDPPLDAAKRPFVVRKLLRAPRPNPMMIVLVTFELEELGPAAAPEMARLSAWLEENAPHLPDAMLLRAERLAVAGRWAEVAEVLAPLAASSGPESELCPFHAHHLSVLAHLHLGDRERAREILGRVGVPRTPCPFAALHDLLTDLPDPLPPEAWGPDRSFVVRVLGAVRHADACLLRGDAAAVVSALARDPFSTCGAIQLVARLAEAWLHVPAESKRDRVHKGTALGRFVAAHAEKDSERRRGMPIPGATWDDARLDDLSARAMDWLEMEG